MTDDDIHSQVLDVAELVLRVPRGELDRPRQEIPEWDSLKHVALLFAVEDELGVSFDAQELADLDSTASITAAVRRHR